MSEEQVCLSWGGGTVQQLSRTSSCCCNRLLSTQAKSLQEVGRFHLQVTVITYERAQGWVAPNTGGAPLASMLIKLLSITLLFILDQLCWSQSQLHMGEGTHQGLGVWYLAQWYLSSEPAWTDNPDPCQASPPTEWATTAHFYSVIKT